jgi:SnoaL-like domain
MDMIAKLAAIEGIKLAKARHQRGVDTKDGDLLHLAFAEDVEIDCRGVMTDSVTGANMAPATDEVIRGSNNAVNAALMSLKGVISVHHVSLPEIEVTGPTSGVAIWPMVDRVRYGSDAPFQEIIGYGFYHETYERVGDDWKIKKMRLERTRMDFVPW